MANDDWQDELLRARQCERKVRAMLGVPENVGQDAIRHAFRRAVRQCHPDSGGGGGQDPRRFNLVCRAYKLLTEGQAFPELDDYDLPSAVPGKTKYNLNNPWGYWCWWRDTYLGDDK
ncbi:MAG TPA: J domain-containing protein [Planctomycetota bacterium]|nr:J domain-containing protein [Planctomycetota bacterium]